MMVELVAELRSHHLRLTPFEKTDGFAHDVVEAIEYWCSLADRAMAKDERVNYPERANGQMLWLRELQASSESKQSPLLEQYREVFRSAERLLKLIKNVPLPSDGYLDTLRTIRENFGFLKQQYGFRVVKEEPTGTTFQSESVYVHLESAATSYLSFDFGAIGGQHSFSIDDLLYLYGDERYRTIPYRLEWNTKSEVASWFRFIAEVLRKYGGDVLRGDEKAFQALKAAQEKRDREYVQEMERLHASSQSQD